MFLTLLMILPRVALIILRSGSLPIQIRMEGPGFLSPFYFRASHLRVEWDSPRTDRVLVRCARIRFRISILPLFRFRLQIAGLHIEDLYLEYENRIDSYRKTDLLPRPGRMTVDLMTITSGEVTLIDRTLPGPYQLRIRQIFIEDGRFDLATSTNLLFQIKRGRALLGRGLVLSHRNGKSGTILLRNVDWNSILGQGDLPYLSDLPGATFSLFVRHRELSLERTAVQGRLNLLGSRDREDPAAGGGIPFEFEVNWSLYRVTVDLGIQKLIEEILRYARPGLIEKGVLFLGKELFERIKKTDRNQDMED